MRVRGNAVIGRKVSHLRFAEDSDEDTDENELDSEGESACADSSETDGATSTVEGKIKFTEEDPGQVVATCVVASFTEQKLHPNLQTLVPTILIDVNRCCVCLYDCRLDVLLISAPKAVAKATKDGLSRSAMLFLWLTINHR